MDGGEPRPRGGGLKLPIAVDSKRFTTVDRYGSGAMVLETIDSAVSKITSAFGSSTDAAEDDSLHQYQCFDCGMDFKSSKDKEQARCPDCGGIPAPDTEADTAE